MKHAIAIFLSLSLAHEAPTLPKQQMRQLLREPKTDLWRSLFCPCCGRSWCYGCYNGEEYDITFPPPAPPALPPPALAVPLAIPAG